MKIAIHNRNESFSKRWIEYCEKKSIPYKIVNCYDNDIIDQLKDCDALLWHHHHANYKDVLFAKPLLFSLEQSGKIVFPDFNTNWHFDDKVGQKYLFESIEAPHVPSFVFYDKASAIKWAKSTSFPKVFKLRGGAGSANVRLVKTYFEAAGLINQCFGRGFSKFNKYEYFKEQIRKYKQNKSSSLSLFKGCARLLIPTKYSKIMGKERGYAYFQEFIPNNDSDIRVIVTGDKAFAIKRMTRENDFRASGSGTVLFNKSAIDENCIKIAFDVNKKINSQSVAYDFVFDENNNPLIIEISYAYMAAPYDACEGYWDEKLNWYEGKFCPQNWIIEDILQKIVNKS